MLLSIPVAHSTHYAHSVHSTNSIMDTNEPPDRPSTPPDFFHIIRDQRLQIQTLHDAGHTYNAIRNQLPNLTQHQI